MQYDDTIRNSEKTVVQFVYGDDGLNPQNMEISKKKELYGVGTVDVALPADFNEIMGHVVASEPCLDELPLSPEGIVAVGMKVRVGVFHMISIILTGITITIILPILKILQQPCFTRLMSKDQSKQWWYSAEKFVKDLALSIEKVQLALNIPDNANGSISEACKDDFMNSNSSCVEDVGGTFELQKHQNATIEATQVSTCICSSLTYRYSCIFLPYYSCAYI